MLTKTQIHRAFNGRVSKSMLSDQWCGVTDEWAIVGKYCRILPAKDEGTLVWDVFICNPDDVMDGLTERKLSAILRRIEERLGKDPSATLYDGEAAVLMTADEVVACLDILGIRKARVVTEEQKEAFMRRISHVAPLVRTA